MTGCFPTVPDESNTISRAASSEPFRRSFWVCVRLLCSDGLPVVWTGDVWPVDCRASESAGDQEWEDMDDEEGSGDDCSSAGLPSHGGDRSAPGSPREAIRNHLFWEEETKSRFTEYSMTSSVMRRNEQLTLHDERFEKVRALGNVTEFCLPLQKERLEPE